MTQEREPGSSNDAPVDRADFERRFATEAACRAYLVGVRWPAGFVCPDPACDGRRAWLSARGLYRCVACERQSSPTAGTLLAGTRKPVRAWFEVLWRFAGEDGLSAEGLRVTLSLGSYETAWAWLHKVRRAIAQREPVRLTGIVELAAFPLWSVEGGSGRPSAPRVALAVEARGAETGRIRLARLQGRGALERFLADAVLPGARLRTYPTLGARLARLGFTVLPSRTKLGVFLWQLDPVRNQLEEWCRVTHRSAISRRHLDAYLAEFVFRFNRAEEPQGERFRQHLEVALAAAPKTRASLVGGIVATSATLGQDRKRATEQP